LPVGNGQLVLSLAGQGMNGKLDDQRVGALFTRHGVALFAMDPVAQGTSRTDSAASWHSKLQYRWP